jgi:copper chaperone CopZ
MTVRLNRMLTNLRVDGANCSLCFNDIIDRLRSVAGINHVDSSITEGCISVDHNGTTRTDLVELIGTSLHGVTMASNEIVMKCGAEHLAACVHPQVRGMTAPPSRWTRWQP